ncbi:MAG TPA: hypothetical protein PKC72_13375 [Chitinophagaceae bacterium]|nr:hypothetical protein [Chitinophagaceae bacterium]
MKRVFLFLLCFNITISFCQIKILKVVGTDKLYAFYDDESLKKNNKGEVIQGAIATDQIFNPQGTTLNLAFKQSEIVIFNERGKLISGTLLVDYTLKTENGTKTFFAGDNITFGINGKILTRTESTSKTNNSNVCIFSNKKYPSIAIYCNSKGYVAGESINEITSGILAESNLTVIGCHFQAKLKKNTLMEFYATSRFYFISNDKPEYKKELRVLEDCMNKTIIRFTIDGNHRFDVWGYGSIEFPDGTEIEFFPDVIKPGFFYKGYNLVHKAKLGRDTYIERYGLLKKGQVIIGEYGGIENTGPFQGTLYISDNWY